MNEWNGVRRFGSHPESVTCTIRPSAYGFVEDNFQHLAVVRSVEGVFLPGGGIKTGETPIAAVIREVIEECGLLVSVGVCVTRAIQFTYFESTGKGFEKRSFFYETEIIEEQLSSALLGHEVMWLSSEEATETLSHESQKWAIQQWLNRITSQ